MIEFQDSIPGLEPDLIPPFVRAFLWDRWDAMRQKRIKLHWGPLHPSFRLYVFDPLIEKFIGPRPA